MILSIDKNENYNNILIDANLILKDINYENNINNNKDIKNVFELILDIITNIYDSINIENYIKKNIFDLIKLNKNNEIHYSDFDNSDFDNSDFDNSDFDNNDFDNNDFDNNDFDISNVEQFNVNKNSIVKNELNEFNINEDNIIKNGDEHKKVDIDISNELKNINYNLSEELDNMNNDLNIELEFINNILEDSLISQNSINILIDSDIDKKEIDKKKIDKKEIDKKEIDKKEINKKEINKKDRKKKNEFLDVIKNSIIENVKLTENEILKNKSIVNELKQINSQLADQRTKEWYEFRSNRLTASSLYYALFGTASKKNSVIIDKCEPKTQKSGGGKACIHGNRYEDVSIQLYEKKNNAVIEEYGCLPHKDINNFAASPDGICGLSSNNLVGRMIEIKNPTGREITGIPLTEYWMQMQGQMEVANLNYCDFLETKIIEYDSKNDFYKDGCDTITNDNKEKGAVIASYITLTDLNNNEYSKIKYYYSPLNISIQEFEEWITKTTDLILNNENEEYNNIFYWRLETYSCITIKRDKIWFNSVKNKINEFWKEVEYYKINGCDSIRPKKKKEKKEQEEICNFLPSDDDN